MLAVRGVEGARLVPLVRYRNVGAAIDWLESAFAFEKHLIANGDDGGIVYAQMKFGDALVMLSPVEGSGLEGLFKQPDEIGGAATQCSYIIVADVDAHRERAQAAGAEIILPDASGADPRRGYSCRDLEGHIWSFGSFDPWQNGERAAAAPAAKPPRAGARALSTLVLLLVLLGAGVVTVMIDSEARALYEKVKAELIALVTPIAGSELEVPQPVAAARPEPANGSAIPEADREARIAERLLALQKGAREAAESAARRLSDQLAKERLDKESAVKLLESAKQQLASERSAKDAAERKARENGDKLVRAERISESWMLRAEQAEAKAQAAEANAREATENKLETGSPPINKQAYPGAAAPPPSGKPGIALAAPSTSPGAGPQAAGTTAPVATTPAPASQSAAIPVAPTPAAKPASRPRVARSRAKKPAALAQDTKPFTFGPW